MSTLTIFPAAGADAPKLATCDPRQIAAILHDHGVRFEQWEASKPLAAGASQEQVLDAYAEDVARLMAEGGYQTSDVLSIPPDHPDREAMRTKFLSEHTHSEDEVRFFVAGSGAFYFHVGDEVLQVVCEQGDLMSVPAGTRHWFDMGPAPSLHVIRIFTDPAGWVASFTGDDIAARHPLYE